MNDNAWTLFDAAVMRAVENSSSRIGFQFGGITSMIVFPNPASENMNITYVLDEDAWVNIDLYDVMGKRIRMMSDCRELKGLHKVSFGIGGNRIIKSSGIYFIELIARSGFGLSRIHTNFVYIKP